MKQIKEEFADHYYLTEQGTVYNEAAKKEIKPDNNHCFRLLTKEGKLKKISLKRLFKLVYNKNYCIDNIEDLEGEQWKAIDLTDNIYWISSKGRCKSLANYEAIILKTSLVNGYERVDIFQEGQRKRKLVSRLVAAAFLDPPKYQDMQIHHIDQDKRNNNKSNLIWLTPKQHKEAHKRSTEPGKEWSAAAIENSYTGAEIAEPDKEKNIERD